MLTIEDKRKLVTTPVTINNKPATISGARNDYATVTALDGSVRADWNWYSTARIVASGGKFKA